MGAYVLKRLVHSIPVIFAVTIASFLIIVAVPGDPALNMLGSNATPESLAILHRELNLDDPLLTQLLHFFRNLAVLDLGESIIKRASVGSVVVDHAIPTFLLLIYAAVISVVIGVPLAIVSALRRNRLPDHLIRIGSMVTFAMPSFWLGLLLALFFSLYLGWFPIAGYDDSSIGSIVMSLTLPALTIGLFLAPIVLRTMRVGIADVLNAEYVEAARSRGYSEKRVVTKHVLRNALIGTITVLSINFGFMISGSVIVENVFQIPGLGTLLVEAVVQRDYPLVQGLTLFLGLAVITVNLFADLAYAVADPRVRLG